MACSCSRGSSSGAHDPAAVTEQLATVMTHLRHSLASIEPRDPSTITDDDLAQVRFRMLDPDPELRRAMAFDDTYILLGNKGQMTGGARQRGHATGRVVDHRTVPRDAAGGLMAGLAPLFTWRSALAESDLPSTTKHVAVALSLYMNERGGSAHPGATRLAKDTSLHKTTVLRSLGQLEEDGWLVCKVRGSARAGGARRASEYVARIPGEPDADGDRSHSPTGPSDNGDRSLSVQRPVAQDDPISSGNSSGNSPPGEQLASSQRPVDDRQPSSKQRIIAAYVERLRRTPQASPPATFVARCARTDHRPALADGADVDELVSSPDDGRRGQAPAVRCCTCWPTTSPTTSSPTSLSTTIVGRTAHRARRSRESAALCVGDAREPLSVAALPRRAAPLPQGHVDELVVDRIDMPRDVRDRRSVDHLDVAVD
jgi:hypothetical protein